jgi:hypothetical protein
VLLLLILVFQFATTPVDNAVSRYIEHQADVFGLEVIHGIVTDSPQVAAEAFQILGEANLEEPDPSPAVVFWFYTHPPIADRIGFALSYDPWSTGGSPQFIHYHPFGFLDALCSGELPQQSPRAPRLRPGDVCSFALYVFFRL